MKVTNHGVPEDLKEAVTETCKELFSLPEEEKAEYMHGGRTDGSYTRRIRLQLCRRRR